MPDIRNKLWDTSKFDGTRRNFVVHELDSNNELEGTSVLHYLVPR